MILSFTSQIALLLLFAACLFAFAKGGPAERWGAILIWISWLGGDGLSFLLKGIFSTHARELTLLAMDAVLALGLLLLAFRYAKLWLGVAMLMLSGELALHGAVMGDWGLPFFEYIMLNNFLSFGLVLLLAGATATAWIQRTHQSRARTMPDETSADVLAGGPMI
jgi:hypothetical protein